MNKSALIISTIILLLLSLAVQGQTSGKHQSGIYMGGGLSTIHYNPDGATHKPCYGGELGLAYNYFFSPKWSLSTGLGLGIYQAKAESSLLSGNNSGIDPVFPDKNYTMNYTYLSFEEKQKLYLLNIPIMLQYWISPKFYVAAGGKLGIPASGYYEISAANLTTTGSFSHEGRTYSGLDYGFQSSDNKYIKQNLDLKSACILSAELGMKWKVSKTKLFTSLYVDYGVNNMQKTTTNTLISYQPEDSGYLKLNSITSISNKINILSTGIKTGLSF